MEYKKEPGNSRVTHAVVLSKLVVIAMCLALAVAATAFLSGCSGASGSAGSSAVDTTFLTEDTWQCTGAVSASDGKTHELGDVLNARVMSLNFFSDDECRIYVDTNFTIVKWELSGNDITLSGDGTYHLTVQDDGTKLVWDDFEGTGYNLEFAKD